jgi:hypothetical protein
MNNLPLQLRVLNQLPRENAVCPLEPSSLRNYAAEPHGAKRDTDYPCVAVERGVTLWSMLVFPERVQLMERRDLLL